MKTMTKQQMIKIIKSLGADAYLSIDHKKGTAKTILAVDLNDFIGFDEDWNEIFRSYDDPKKVELFKEMLEKTCITKKDNFYQWYYYNDFIVVLGYTSYDI